MAFEKPNKTCILCGTAYAYCPNCQSFNSMPKWKMLFHDENCKKIFHAVSDYKSQIIDDVQFKAIISSCDLSNKESFKQNAKECINSVLNDYIPAPIAEDIAVYEEINIPVEEVVEAPVETVVEITEPVIETETVNRFRKKYKKNFE